MPTQKNTKPKADFIFEISWEICNQVGGIHTVIKTKMSEMVNYYGDNLILIGPYCPKKAKGNFKEETEPEDFKKIFEDLEREGLKIHYGRWLIEEEPKVILLDFTDYWKYVDDIKTELWENYGVDSLNASYSYNYDFNEPVVWSRGVGRVLEKIEPLYKKKNVVCQFHEWASGAGLLYLKTKNSSFKSVFTTHATMLGRTLADNGIDLYSKLKEFDSVKEAYSYGVEAKHLLERASAQNADVFTTVSEITSLEAKYLLEIKPHVILPNGLSLNKFNTFEEVAIRHRINKERIKRFLMYYFFPYYHFDIENTLLYFLAGRYEFHNKGIDLFIKSLGRLNEKLKKEKSKKTIVTFFWVPAGPRGVKRGLIESREILENIKGDLEERWNSIESKMLNEILKEESVSNESLLDESLIKEIKRKNLKLKRDGAPPLSTHDLQNNETDGVLNSFKSEGLLNREEDRVKVIFYPIYLNGNDGLLNLEYEECIEGCHLGVFPSFYEPWGYTPLETAALGVVSATTDVAGFGRFVEDEANRYKETGVFILPRFGKDEEEEVDGLVEILQKFYKFTHKQRVQNKLKAREIAALADWNVLIKEYIKAHNLALKNK